MILRLPWPPSVNSYWRHVGSKVLISRAGRQYRKDVGALCLGKRGFGASRLSVSIVANPPDRRRRDIDNLGKALLDSLQSAGIYDDDGQIDRLIIERGPVVAGGGVVLDIIEYSPS